jgi:hypothetical protein
LQRPAEIDRLFARRRKPVGPVAFQIEHDVRGRAAELLADIEDPCLAEPVEP